jgi:hypothetical protein
LESRGFFIYILLSNALRPLRSCFKFEDGSGDMDKQDMESLLTYIDVLYSHLDRFIHLQNDVSQ